MKNNASDKNNATDNNTSNNNSTYKWIIGCLLGVIVSLITYLILSEKQIICISFSEALSLASTISSLILSVIAMIYTYYSGKNTDNVFTKIQGITTEVDKQIQQVSADTRRNAETLSNITQGIRLINDAVNSSSEALDTIQNEKISAEEKQNAKETIEKTKNSMMMFLDKMNKDS